MGIDKIGDNVLKNCVLALYQHLYYLFNTSLTNHVLPAEWRIHCISPIHKSGDMALVSNNHPISLLYSTSKLLERIVYDKIIDLLASTLLPAQFGFLRKHSTLQLLLFQNNIFGSDGKKSQTDVIVQDFTKAFDIVPHKELLVKQWSKAVTGSLWLWLKGYVTGRMHCVHFGGSSSELLPVAPSVLQGSILAGSSTITGIYR